jgi:hypothetical protein
MDVCMAEFMIAYHGGDKPASKEDGMIRMQKWKTWVASLGDAIINPGTPLLPSKVVTLNGVEDDTDSKAMHGFSVIQADSIEDAVAIAKLDPFLESGGMVYVSQMVKM